MKEAGVRAQTIWPSSFHRGRNFQMSSTRPSRKTPHAEAAVIISSGLLSRPRIEATLMKDRKMATPPQTGVGATCSRFEDPRASQGKRDVK